MRTVAAFRAAFALLAVAVGVCHAYIDPATGGMVINSLGYVVYTVLLVMGAFLVRHFFNPIKETIERIWQKLLRRDRKGR